MPCGQSDALNRRAEGQSAPGWIRTSDRRIRSSAGRCLAGRIWPNRANHVQGVRLSSLELGTNFGTKFCLVSRRKAEISTWVVEPRVSSREALWQLVAKDQTTRRV